jgi:type II secretory pathway component PulK
VRRWNSRTKRGPFLTIDELRTVKGIGAKRLEQLRPLVVAGPVDTRSQTIHPTGRRFSDKAAL